ncbi:MAG TPA: hypothetical protein VEN47_14135 [Myxococcota bacterium]|nr:hypothetical protein [Myxococcota bacterium]
MSRLILLAAALFAAGCGPTYVFHGGRLGGEEVAAPVDDWSFTDAVHTIQVETNPESPYSVNAWCVAKGPNLWVTAGGGGGAQWGKNLLDDRRMRVRVLGKLYERQAVRVTDPGEIALVRSLYVAKYDAAIDLTGREHAIIFRLDPPP